MVSIPLEAGLLLAAVLFVIGLVGILIRRNILFILLSIEILLNASGLAFIVAGYHWNQPDGQVMFFFILTMAAAEVAVGLALALLMFHEFKTLNIDQLTRMQG
ncbi:MAG: NADH-quinone oxidoreductase subunit NuoK [Candidatus Abyssobacteria bacterium SURF_5]|uniref:NADH-quinone oxidoreductase subunit K n=1 Tax=Abyssobacteria bacterium (strain SURF_5) TaxID=2093360 RepID=A0A3A4ND72_ABYX5|nr:MAG: NADH-quinone oxidoreductase subunit NuoK [Candidatus Abyssubacteria bacterium SURF_5]